MSTKQDGALPVCCRGDGAVEASIHGDSCKQQNRRCAHTATPMMTMASPLLPLSASFIAPLHYYQQQRGTRSRRRVFPLPSTLIILPTAQPPSCPRLNSSSMTLPSPHSLSPLARPSPPASPTGPSATHQVQPFSSPPATAAPSPTPSPSSTMKKPTPPPSSLPPNTS